MLVKKDLRKTILYVFLLLLGFSLTLSTGFFLLHEHSKPETPKLSEPFGPEKDILFISSYSENYTPVAYQTQGINEAFDGKNVHFDIEYMDMAHYNSAENENLFFTELQYKLGRHKPYDAVLVGDDAALRFAEKNQEVLFKNTPIVFFCVNDVDYAKEVCANPYITGITEIFSLKDTLSVAATLTPQAKTVIALYDNTLTGQGDIKQFFALADSFPGYTFEGINASDYTHDAFGAKIESIKSDSIVVYFTCTEDSSGETYQLGDIVRYITSRCSVPVYCPSYKGMGDGLAGGKLFSFKDAGYKAGLLVNSILAGTPPADIPIESADDNRYCFDYTVLRKYNLNVSLLPKDSVLLYKKPGFMEQNKTVLIPALCFLATLLLILLISFLDNFRMQRYASVLQEANVQLKEKEEQILYQNKHDYLTGLPNRRDAMEHLESMIALRQALTLMLMDIDDFKEINDSDGHACGDAILAEFGRRISVLARTHDFYASRSGGDEFLIIAKTTDPGEIDNLLTNITGTFESPVGYNGKEYSIKTSIGIVSTNSGEAKTRELIGNADLAMFSAKKSGKNGYAYFDSAMSTQFIQKKHIEAILSEACRSDGFTVVYQPQVDLATGTTHCFEALLRLKDSTLSPSQFIPVAEETDLILVIGRTITAKVIEQMVSWRNSGLSLRPVSINFSSKQLRDKEYVPYLKNLLDVNGIPPDLIEIEITESILLAHTENASKLFQAFTDIGVKLTLDDFGTGYSSINYLTYIPVRKIKLDKSFVDVYLNEGKDAVIDNIIRLSHCLGLTITVEGIEKKEQCERLRDFSCDYIQGYYFSRPVAGGEIEAPGYGFK